MIPKSILFLLLIAIVNNAIINNCLKYFFSSTEPQRYFCLQCRDGFYVKLGNCIQCTRFVKNIECLTVKTMNYGSNIVNSSGASSIPKDVKFNQTKVTINNFTNSTISNANNGSIQGSKISQNQTKDVVQSNNIKTSAVNYAKSEEAMMPTQQKLNASQIISKTQQQNATQIPLQSAEKPKQNTTSQIVETSGDMIANATKPVQIANQASLNKTISVSQSKLQKCAIYSELSKKCMVCEQGCDLTVEGACQLNPNAKVQQIPTLFNSTQLLFSKFLNAQILANNAKKPNSSAEGTSEVKIQDLLLIQAPKQKQYTINLHISNSSNSQYKRSSQSEISLPSLKPSQSPIAPAVAPMRKIVGSSAPDALAKQPKKAQQIRIVQSIQSGNSSELVYIIKSSSAQPCLQYANSSKAKGLFQRICVKCIEGYFLNTLSNECVSINKPVTLSNHQNPNNLSKKTTNSGKLVKAQKKQMQGIKKDNITTMILIGTTLATNASEIVTNYSSIASSKNISNDVKHQNNQTNMNINMNMNISIQANKSNPGVTTNNTSNSTSNNNSINNSAGSSTIENKTENNLNGSLGTNKSISNVGILQMGNAVTSNNNVSVISNSATNGSNTASTITTAIGINNNTNNSINTNGLSKYNISRVLDPKTNKTVLVVGTTTNPPASNKQAGCIKYRDITYDCLQCEHATYVLSAAKCLPNINGNGNGNGNNTASITASPVALVNKNSSNTKL